MRIASATAPVRALPAKVDPELAGAGRDRAPRRRRRSAPRPTAIRRGGPESARPASLLKARAAGRARALLGTSSRRDDGDPRAVVVERPRRPLRSEPQRDRRERQVEGESTAGRGCRRAPSLAVQRRAPRTRSGSRTRATQNRAAAVGESERPGGPRLSHSSGSAPPGSHASGNDPSRRGRGPGRGRGWARRPRGRIRRSVARVRERRRRGRRRRAVPHQRRPPPTASPCRRRAPPARRCGRAPARGRGGVRRARAAVLIGVRRGRGDRPGRRGRRRTWHARGPRPCLPPRRTRAPSGAPAPASRRSASFRERSAAATYFGRPRVGTLVQGS